MLRGALVLLCALPLGLTGCVEPIATAQSCGDLTFERPVLFLEHAYAGPSSGLGRLAENGCLSEVADIAISGNALLRSARGRPFVLDAEQSVVHEIDGEKLAIKKTRRVASEAQRPNPHDIDIDEAGRLWVLRYDLGSLAVIDRNDGIKPIELSDLDPDGVPQMEAIRILDGLAYVALELLDNKQFKPRGPGLVSIIDTRSDMRVGTIQLSGRNPFGRFVSMNTREGELAIATAGDFYSIDPQDGIEAIDPGTGKTRQIISEETLGGSVWEFVFAREEEGYAIVLMPELPNATKVVAFNPKTGMLIKKSANDSPVLISSATFTMTGLALVGDRLLVTSSSPKEPVTYVFDQAEGRRRGTIEHKIMPPWSLLTL